MYAEIDEHSRSSAPSPSVAAVRDRDHQVSGESPTIRMRPEQPGAPLPGHPMLAGLRRHDAQGFYRATRTSLNQLQVNLGQYLSCHASRDVPPPSSVSSASELQPTPSDCQPTFVGLRPHQPRHLEWQATGVPRQMGLQGGPLYGVHQPHPAPSQLMLIPQSPARFIMPDERRQPAWPRARTPLHTGQPPPPSPHSTGHFSPQDNSAQLPHFSTLLPPDRLTPQSHGAPIRLWPLRYSQPPSQHHNFSQFDVVAADRRLSRSQSEPAPLGVCPRWSASQVEVLLLISASAQDQSVTHTKELPSQSLAWTAFKDPEPTQSPGQPASVDLDRCQRHSQLTSVKPDPCPSAGSCQAASVDPSRSSFVNLGLSPSVNLSTPASVDPGQSVSLGSASSQSPGHTEGRGQSSSADSVSWKTHDQSQSRGQHASVDPASYLNNGHSVPLESPVQPVSVNPESCHSPLPASMGLDACQSFGQVGSVRPNSCGSPGQYAFVDTALCQNPGGSASADPAPCRSCDQCPAAKPETCQSSGESASVNPDPCQSRGGSVPVDPVPCQSCDHFAVAKPDPCPSQSASEDTAPCQSPGQTVRRRTERLLTSMDPAPRRSPRLASFVHRIYGKILMQPCGKLSLRNHSQDGSDTAELSSSFQTHKKIKLDDPLHLTPEGFGRVAPEDVLPDEIPRGSGQPTHAGSEQAVLVQTPPAKNVSSRVKTRRPQTPSRGADHVTKAHMSSASPSVVDETARSKDGTPSDRNSACLPEGAGTPLNRDGVASGATAQLIEELKPGTPEGFSCADCSVTVDTATAFLAHRRLQHPDSCPFQCAAKSCAVCVPVPSRALSCERRFKCTQCGTAFQTKGNLGIHLRIHLKVKPFTCEHCGRGFAQKHHLQDHARTLAGEKPHQCVVCKKSFATKSSLKRHLIRHVGFKPFGCAACGARFFERRAHDKHMRQHAGDRPFACAHPQCRSAFVRSYDLKRHMLLHSEYRPRCPSCGKGFRAAAGLQRHVAKCHS